MAFNSGLQRGAALQAAARSARSAPGLGPVYRNTTGNSRSGMFYRSVNVPGGRVHVYENGRRVFVAQRDVPAPVVPSRKGIGRGIGS